MLEKDFSKCQCPKAGWCELLKKEMTAVPPNWQWCQELSETERKKYHDQCNGRWRVTKVSKKSLVNVVNFYDEIQKPKSDYAVCVIPANELAMELLDTTREGVKDYAKRCGADYIELTGDQCPDWPVSNKFRVHSVAKVYKKTLYLDCDIAISKDAPNIFEETPDDKISAVDEWFVWEGKRNTQWIIDQQEKIVHRDGGKRLRDRWIKNGNFETESMLNGGVLVIPQSSADLYKQPENPYSKFWCFDQHMLTLNLGKEVNKLDERYNVSFNDQEFWDKISSAYFVHVNNIKDTQFRKNLLPRVFDNVGKLEPTDFINAGTFLTIANMTDRAISLCEKLPEIKGVIGLPRSGMIAASVVAINLSLPLYSLSKDRICKLHSRSSDGGSRMSQFEPSKEKLPYLVLDDTSYSGAELVRVRKLLKEKYPEEEFLFSTIYTTPEVEYKTDEYGSLLDIVNARAYFPHILEWNFFNAHTTVYGMFDLDGVFCPDCPYEIAEDKELYEDWICNVEPIKSRIPKLFECMAICTGRLEKYRPETEAWLKKHGIKYKTLIMFDGTKKQRDSDHLNKVGKYKAKQFNSFKGNAFGVNHKPLYFIESCPAQSRLIAEKKTSGYVISINEKVTF
jgi:orotate phosphoribosyltransferase